MCFLARSYYIFIYIFYSKACALFNPSVLQAFIRSHNKLVWFTNNPVPVWGDDWWQPKSSLSWVHGWLQISGTTKDTQVGSIGSKEDVDKKFPRRRPHWSAHLFGHCAGLMLAENTYHRAVNLAILPVCSLAEGSTMAGYVLTVIRELLPREQSSKLRCLIETWITKAKWSMSCEQTMPMHEVSVQGGSY